MLTMILICNILQIVENEYHLQITYELKGEHNE